MTGNSSADRYCNPPFRITRISHVCLTVRDLDASCAFYETLGGFQVSERSADAAYLRGVEEIAHHSLVLRRSDAPGTCDVIGFRVMQDSDLDAASAYFKGLEETTEWVSRHGQGRTLLVRHSSGLQFELVAEMVAMPRVLTDMTVSKGGRVYRLDHVQVIIPDVPETGHKFYDMGFRASEIVRKSENDLPMTLFLHRKNNPHDIVLATGAGPRLHHFAMVISDLQAMIRACDTAGNMGIGHEVERGPGRHGPGNSMFVYFRDPDGHRIEMILPPMQFMDVEEEPNIWDVTGGTSINPWGPRPSQRWREEATPFTDVAFDATGDMTRWTSG